MNGKPFRIFAIVFSTGQPGSHVQTAPDGVRRSRLSCLLVAKFPALLLTMILLMDTGIGASHYQRLKSFGSLVDSGGRPWAPLIQGSDGALYGTTSEGGAYKRELKDGYVGVGTVFRLNKDGTGYTLLHSFGSDGDGWWPQARLLEASDGALYGTTVHGGEFTNQTPYGYGYGTVFKLNKNGSDYRVLHSFNSLDGVPLETALVEGSDGTLYGISEGVTNNAGVLFKLNKDGSDYNVLRIFGSSSPDGQWPSALLRGSDGALYGTTSGGGANNAGTVFRLNPDGSGYSVLRSFGSSSVDGREPFELLQGSDGALYGITSIGGASTNGLGTMFRLNKDGSGYTVLHSFSSITASNSLVILTWSSFTGANYRVEYNTNTVGTNWIPLVPDITATNGMATLTDTQGTDPQRFYRVSLVP
jgi:uncharacterized repeat protein (TIGR03803 family)